MRLPKWTTRRRPRSSEPILNLFLCKSAAVSAVPMFDVQEHLGMFKHSQSSARVPARVSSKEEIMKCLQLS